MAEQKKFYLGDVVYHKASGTRLVVIEDKSQDKYNFRYTNRNGHFKDQVLNGFEVTEDVVLPTVSRKSTKKALPAK